MVMGTFGHKVFEPIVQKGISHDNRDSEQSSDEPLFHFDRTKGKAYTSTNSHFGLAAVNLVSADI